jgi:hypothetical protein
MPTTWGMLGGVVEVVAAWCGVVVEEALGVGVVWAVAAAVKTARRAREESWTVIVV